MGHNKAMRIFITGGTGFIGSHFIKRFPEYEYTVLARDLERAKQVLPDSVTFIESLDQIQNFDAYDAVVNLAGEPIIDKRWSGKQKDRICQSRWQLTQQLVQLIDASKSPPGVFLSGSAIGVYGNHSEQWIDESTPVESSDFPSTVCVHWEEIANRVSPQVRLVTLRTGIVLAKEQGALSKMLLPFKLGLGGPLGHGNQFMSWIHIDDMTSAMKYLLDEAEISGPVNLVSPNPVMNKMFTRALAAQLKRFAILPMPGFVLKALMGESSVLLLDSQRLKPNTLLENGFQFRYPELELALTDLLN